MKRLLPMASSSEVGCAVGERTATRSFYQTSQVSHRPAAISNANSKSIQYREPRSHSRIRIPQPSSRSTTHLQHMEQRSLASVIQPQEKKLGMLVEEAKRSQNIVNCGRKDKDHQ